MGNEKCLRCGIDLEGLRDEQMRATKIMEKYSYRVADLERQLSEAKEREERAVKWAFEQGVSWIGDYDSAAEMRADANIKWVEWQAQREKEEKGEAQKNGLDGDA